MKYTTDNREQERGSNKSQMDKWLDKLELRNTLMHKSLSSLSARLQKIKDIIGKI